MPRGVKNAIVVDKVIRLVKSVPVTAWIFLGWIVFCIVFFTYLFLANTNANSTLSMRDTDEEESEFNLLTEDGRTCNVVGLAVRGGLTTYVPAWWYEDPSLSADERNIMSSEYISSILDEAKYNPDVKAVILEVDSGGGSPVAGEEIAESVKHIGKPVVGLVRGMAASAAYWAISPSYPIFASRNSDIGGIGVTASYAEKIDEDAHFIQLSTGKYKDTGNPDKPLTDEEKELIMRDIEIIHDNFIRAIADNRDLDIERVREMADGATVLGETALTLGLIDKIGSLYDAVDYLKEEILREEALICWY